MLRAMCGGGGEDGSAQTPPPLLPFRVALALSRTCSQSTLPSGLVFVPAIYSSWSWPGGGIWKSASLREGACS